MVFNIHKYFHFLIASIVSLVIIGMSTIIVWIEHRNNCTIAEVSVLNTAEIVAQQIETSFDNTDEFIKSVAIRYLRTFTDRNSAIEHLAASVTQEVSHYKMVSRIGIANTNGTVIFTTDIASTSQPQIDIADHNYFKKAKDGEHQLLFDGPLQTKPNGEWSLILARRIEDGRGRFQGIIFAAVPIEAIGTGFSRIDLGSQGVINLRTADLAQVVRHPVLSGTNTEIGNRNVSVTIKNLMQENPGREHYVYTTEAPIDHIERVYAYKKFNHSPFWMTVGRATKDFTASIQQTVLFMTMLSLAMASILIWGARRLTLQSTILEQRISEKEQAEKQLKESETRLATILNSLESCVYLKDIQGRYIYANDAVCRIFNVQREDIIGATDHAFFDPATAATIGNNDRDVVHTGQARRNEENIIIAKTGQVATYLTVKLPLRHDDGSIYALCGISTDITDRIRAEEEIKQSRQFLRDLTDHLPGMVGYWSRELICQFANKQYQEWFGRDPEHIEGLAIEELIGDKMYIDSKQFIEKSLNGRPQSFEREMTKANGALVTAWVQYIPNIINGETQGFFTFISDITELKRAQQEKAQLSAQLLQAQKMESIGFLAGGIAHDFNNILTVVGGYCALLGEDHSLNEQQRKYVAGIAASSEKAAQLTHGLLAFSRKQPLVMQDTNLNDIVHQVHKFLARIIGEDIKFTSTCCGEELPIRADKGQLEQVLINLATNARDSMPNGGTLLVKTELVTLDRLLDEISDDAMKPGPYALLTFADTGKGISKENLDRIFEPFFTTKAVGQGTGLGMSIIYGIIRQHNGFINVYSELDHGTTFRIYLPIQLSPHRKSADNHPMPPPVGGSETILLAEDDESVRSMVTKILASSGYEVLLAANGEEAVATFTAHQDRIDLVLLDMIMPKKNGMEAYHDIQRLQPKTKVIFSSGYTADFLEKRGVENTEITLLMKPVQPSELLRKVREILDTE